jgi:hypothetical protein
MRPALPVNHAVLSGGQIAGVTVNFKARYLTHLGKVVCQRPGVHAHGIQARKGVVVTHAAEGLLHQRRVAPGQHWDLAVLQTVHLQTEVRARSTLRAARAGIQGHAALAAITHSNHRFDKGDLFRCCHDVRRIDLTAARDLRVSWRRRNIQAPNGHALLLWQACSDWAAAKCDTCATVDACTQLRA